MPSVTLWPALQCRNSRNTGKTLAMSKRNLSIDMFRGLTMVLMVFVNDFWSVFDVPHFLEHFGPGEDGMGLADIVYPMFLFAMGMSVPLAIDKRYEKGFSGESTLLHILGRTLALLLMGAFIVNSEEGVAWNKGVYWLVMLAGFFLVWNAYPKDFKPQGLLRLLGAVILAGLATAYRSPEGGLFRASWWGILGQIGWMYLFAATAYLLCRKKTWILWVLWAAFCLVNLSVAPLRDGSTLVGGNFAGDFSEALNLGNGHSIVMALGGLLTTLADRKLQKSRVAAGLSAAAVLALLGFVTHQWWIVSKIQGTLPWCLYCSAISVALYTVLRVLEKRGLTGWFRPIRLGGTATLTVYMIPYLMASLWVFVNPTVPGWLAGWVGIGKCAVYTALVMCVAWVLDRLKIKLKI